MGGKSIPPGDISALLWTLVLEVEKVSQCHSSQGDW